MRQCLLTRNRSPHRNLLRTWGKSALPALSFLAFSTQFYKTWNMFSSLEETKLTAGTFGFRSNAEMKNLYTLALVLVNPEIYRPTETYYALRTRSFSPSSTQFYGTWNMFSSLRKPELSPGAFGFHWNPLMKNLFTLASVLVNPK